MHLLLPVIAVSIIAIISLVSARKVTVTEKKTSHASSPTISKTVVKPTITRNDKDSDDSPEVSVNIKSETHSNPTPTSPPAQSGNFIYPGSVVVSISGQTTNLTSTDNPNTITDWYKNQIKSQGLNTTSFVVTNTNNNFNNVLAASGSKNIKVTILKNSNETLTRIAVENP